MVKVNRIVHFVKLSRTLFLMSFSAFENRQFFFKVVRVFFFFLTKIDVDRIINFLFFLIDGQRAHFKKNVACKVIAILGVLDSDVQ